MGNKDDPVDELVYIILARKTREEAYQRGFELLKERFDSWDALVDAPRPEVTAIVDSGGLGTKKTESIFAALSWLRDSFGSCTLDPVREWSDEELLDFLWRATSATRRSSG